MYHSNRHLIKKDDKKQALLVDQLNELIKPDGLLNKHMFNGKNLRQFTKNIIHFSSCLTPSNVLNDKNKHKSFLQLPFLYLHLYFANLEYWQIQSTYVYIYLNLGEQDIFVL